jgi:hypothetical protein
MTELKRDTIIIDNRSADKIELQDQITQLPIESPLSLDAFLNLKDETIVNKDKDICWFHRYVHLGAGETLVALIDLVSLSSSKERGCIY